MLVILDTGPLGEIVNPNHRGQLGAIKTWMREHLSRGIRFRIAEIADFEVRRSLVLMTIREARNNSDAEKIQWARDCLSNLDALGSSVGYIPLTTEIMQYACGLWAKARKDGVPTAHDLELDCDVILASQAIVESRDKEQVLIATPNLGHLSRYNTKTVEAKNWSDINIPE